MKHIYDYLLSRYGKHNSEQTMYFRISQLENQVKNLEEKYRDALIDIKRLEEERIETSNLLNEVQKYIEAVDARIDILVVEKFITGETQND